MYKTIWVLLIVHCVQISCECILKDPSDKLSQSLLKKLDPLKEYVFKDTYKDEEQDKYIYTMRICESVSSKLEYVGVIQEDVVAPPDGLSMRKIGLTNSTVIKGGRDWIMLTYMNGDNYHSHCSKSKRQAHIMIVCDPYHLKGRFKVLYEEPDLETESECFYMMEVASSVACSQQGLSTGSVMLIVFFSVLGTYLIIGAIYKRCMYGSKGKDQIPNIGFWKSCGTLQADGCNFLCRCQEGAYSDSRPYHGIADDQLDDEIDDEHLLPM
uniref:Cation-dependent mannose-6-phosphate receptor-like n=1 Tax=Phallusia mammillata TaxID=59560 RepID=A0A6F9DKU2_9ASCI|nr:cation-dependent mannose-6-phosphate receptor-like [Phallusia mammillata]